MRLFRVLLLLVLLVTTSITLVAQTPIQFSGISFGNFKNVSIVLQNATVRVCTIPTSTASPCSTLATIYPINPDGTCSSIANTTGITSSSKNGVYQACALPGSYAIESSSNNFDFGRSYVTVGAGSGGGGGTIGGTIADNQLVGGTGTNTIGAITDGTGTWTWGQDSNLSLDCENDITCKVYMTDGTGNQAILSSSGEMYLTGPEHRHVFYFSGVHYCLHCGGRDPDLRE